MVQQQVSEKEREVKKEEAISAPVQIEEQNSMPDGKRREEEVQEEIVENGLAFEVEQALSNFQLSWDSAGKKDVTGNM